MQVNAGCISRGIDYKSGKINFTCEKNMASVKDNGACIWPSSLKAAEGLPIWENPVLALRLPGLVRQRQHAQPLEAGNTWRERHCLMCFHSNIDQHQLILCSQKLDHHIIGDFEGWDSLQAPKRR